MTLPTLLLVDDSESILAFERAALTGSYSCITAVDGADALEKAAQVVPDGILLDLSMPVMDGDEVLKRLKSDRQLRDVPVIIISSEVQRAEECLGLGAAAFLPKPIRADQLIRLVDRELEKARKERLGGHLQILAMRVAEIDFAVPLESVVIVLTAVATTPLPLGPFYLREYFILHGQPVCVLDVGRRIGAEHTVPPDERKFVVVEHGEQRLALVVDAVHDPDEVPMSDVTPRARLGGSDHGPLGEALLSMAKTTRGSVPVLDAAAFLSRETVRRLPALAAAHRAQVGAP
jgi:CheY-like chemotaxis protein/chemotaxis signal transduction protein